jgi:two-component system chemotaxis response regulator CheY
MKALIVDDAMVVRFMLKKIITELGFEEVYDAGDGKTAVELYKQHQPDLVTMDITMPEMDGLTCIGKIMEFDKEAKIIVCSAMGQRDMVAEAVGKGAKNFLVKPFQEDKVRETVKMVMGL